MSLHFVQSSRLEQLLFHWLMLFVVPPEGLSVFEPEQIVVQCRGMRQWLNFQHARTLGSATNIDYLLPASWVDDVRHQVLGVMPAASPLALKVLP